MILGNISELFATSKSFFKTPIQEFVYYDKYSRYRDDLGRRETWLETVERVVNFLRELSDNKLSEREYQMIYDYIVRMDVSPSMRLFATAGKEARRNNVSVYNCAFLPVADLEAIPELLWISMSGVGAGYSVERKYIDLLPVIQRQNGILHRFTIPDSAAGWVESLRVGLYAWYSGEDVEFDFSQIRPAGAVLKTKGGTASGPQVLVDLLRFTREIVFSAQGRKLRPIEVFDICTSIGSAAVSGGSRRSAQLTMFDLDDYEMRNAKSGAFWNDYPNRVNANISAVIEKELSFAEVKSLMQDMFNSGVGEPGIVSRRAMNLTRPDRRREMVHGGVNACSEIALQGATKDGVFGGEFCNLSTVQVYPHDTRETLINKVGVASLIGTIQSMATDFRLLRKSWRQICEEERLLGVSLIGVMDNPTTHDPEFLDELKLVSVLSNRVHAKQLGINESVATTAVKPSGNSSVMYSVARGINARYAPYYIRRVRVNRYTPMYEVLRESGIPMKPENGYTDENASTYVATFYEKSPDNAITIDNLSAIDQCENWKLFKTSWCEHTPSVTIEYYDHEQRDLVQWIYDNQDILNGMSFLSRDDHIYEQAPYQKISKEEYEEAVKGYPEIDFSLLYKYEKSDTTIRTVDCSAGACELI